jgi:ferredoxin--NADP+ reductase
MGDMARAFVINDRCIKDMRCLAACVRKAIRPTLDDPTYLTASQLHINPMRCIGCGACVNACLSGAILESDDTLPDFSKFAEINAAWFRG